MLIAALKVENRMRLSVEGQAAFARAEAEADQDWMEEAARMHFAALREVGLAPTVRNVALLRATALLHPELALYVRNNRCRPGQRNARRLRGCEAGPGGGNGLHHKSEYNTI